MREGDGEGDGEVDGEVDGEGDGEGRSSVDGWALVDGWDSEIIVTPRLRSMMASMTTPEETWLLATTPYVVMMSTGLRSISAQNS